MENRTKIQFLAFLTGFVEDLKALNAPEDMIEHYENLIKNIKMDLDQERRDAKTTLAIILTYLDFFIEERRKEKQEQEEHKNSKALDYIAEQQKWLKTANLEVKKSKHNPKNNT